MKLLLRIAILAGFGLAAMMSVVHFDVSESAQTLRGTTELVVDDFDRAVPKDMLSAAFGAIAADNRVNIYKLDFGVDSDDRRFYAYIGDQDRATALAPGGEYEDFDPGRSTRIFPADDLTIQDIRGRYLIDGTEQSTQRAIMALADSGFTIATWRGAHRSDILAALSQTKLPHIFAVVILCCALIVAHSAIRSAKTYAIKAQHGYSRFRIVADSLVDLIAICSAAAIASAVAVAGYLYLYNGWTRFDAFLPTLLGALGMLLTLLLLVSAIAVMITLQGRHGQQLKGSTPDAKMLTFAYVAKFALLAVLVVLMAGSVRALVLYADLNRAAQRWLATPDYLALSYAVGTPFGDRAEARELDTAFRTMFADLERENAAFLAVSHDLRPAADIRLDDKPSDLIVDNNFLSTDCVHESTGTCVRGTPLGDLEMHLLIPENRRAEEAAIVDRYRAWIAFQQEVQRSPIDPADIEVTVRYLQADQDVFAFRASNSATDGFVRDPVILVTDANKRLLSDNFYSASSTSGEILFRDRQRLDSALEDSGIGAFLQYYYSIKSLSMQDIAEADQAGRNQLASLVITLIAATTASGLLAALYCGRHRKRIYLKEIHGFSFRRRHATLAIGLLLGSGTVVVGVVLGGGAPTTDATSALILAMVAVDVVITLAFTAAYESRAHQSWLKRA
ncbi:hypothetical protein [Nocardia sp. SSK8]|uniref:hypothetical protein n=1 Tax=Nocardia sp. SSK8 TaxID=3120154 RepID=UPI00300AD8C5